MGRSAGRNPEERPDAAALTALTRQEQLELRLGYGFANPALLTQALTHRSLGTPHNERLEFLGDALLDTVISEELYQRFPEVSEGWMTQIRSRLVREGALAKIAGRLRLSECLRVGKSMQKGGGAAHEALLADALESVIAAIFLDNGHDYAGLCAVVLPWFAEEIAAISPEMPTEDAKSALQEFLQARHEVLPVYKLLGTSGPGNAPVFAVAVSVAGLPDQHASGTTRRSAEQRAAAKALALLKAGDPS